ncbi:MAG: hypothetical protein RLZZ306_3323 [Bacteroidota bacterium]|jgi:hypothetical protein
MKFTSLFFLIFCFEQRISFGQSDYILPATADSIFYLGNQHFKYKGLDYVSARALKKVLNLDSGSDLYESSQQYMRTKRWANALGLFGIGALGASFDDILVYDSQIYPVPFIIGLASVGTTLLLWKKSRKQLRNFVDDYNHAVYDKYIQQRFMSSNLNPPNQIKVCFTLKF